HLAVHQRILADHERCRFAVRGHDVAFDVTIDAQPAGKGDVAMHQGAGANQAIDVLLLRGVPLLVLPHASSSARIQVRYSNSLEAAPKARAAPCCNECQSTVEGLSTD